MRKSRNHRSLCFATLILFFISNNSVPGERRIHRNPFRQIEQKVKATSLDNPIQPSFHQRSEGLAGVRIEEASIIGVISTEDLCLAILRAENQETYIVKAGSTLMNGVVVFISNDAVTFATELPSSTLVKTLIEEPRK
jgi:Tfp pilus assembly protein PilP